ncbi:hypothetical protein FGIG_10700 [Fasciola gigantica]|uniref:rRNA biogenesis protein RRP36 n=1 Tax=Fasciola gigantica TaxID=46835 RepID=A0A504Y8V9_FASGI|nr:hypothetical protein FGIG_10700 [Fasciola gigantica]
MLLRETNPENRAKIKQALHLLRQREASARDRAFRNKKMKQLKNEQIKILQSGKRVKFLRRAELKAKMQSERLSQMTEKQKEKYLERKKRKRPHSLLDQDID